MKKRVGVLVFIALLAGCSAKKGVTGAKALVGTWEVIGDIDDITWTFTGNKFTQTMWGMKQTFPYKIKGNSIFTEYQGTEVEIEFEIDGDTLTTNMFGMEFKRVK